MSATAKIKNVLESVSAETTAQRILISDSCVKPDSIVSTIQGCVYNLGMDENLKDGENVKRTGIFIYCRKGRTRNKHVVGEFVYLNEASPKALYVYKESLNKAPNELPDCKLRLDFGFAEFRCTICGKWFKFYPSAEACKAFGKHDPKFRKMLEDGLKDPDPKKRAEAENILKWVDS